MGVYSGPEIIEDGLILHLDASNARSYDPNGRYENLLNYSNNYSSSPGGWTLGSTGTRAQDIVGPDGVANSAWTITDNDNTGDLVQFYKQISITASSSTNYCISSFVKDVNGTGISPDFYVFFSGSSTKGSYINYNFSTDTITSFASDGGGIQPTIYGRILYPNGWVRIYFVVNDANNGSNTTLQYRIYPNGRGANTTGAMGFYGSQIEIRTNVSEYYKTTGTAKTRGTTWTDLSSSGNNATFQNNLGYNNAGRMQFDGVSDYIQFPSTTISRNGGAFSIWFYVDDFTTFTAGKTVPSRVLVRGDSSFQRVIALYNGGYGYETNTNSDPGELAGRTSPLYAAAAITSGQWINFVVSNENSQSTFYINGVFNRTLNVSDDLQLAYIGRGQDPVNYPDFLKGKVSNFKIYNRALTAVEVQQNFDALRGRFGI